MTMWMNQWEVEEAHERFGRRQDQAPNLARGAEVLYHLMQWTNRNSDGWPYWSKPSRAAKTLMDHLHEASQWRYGAWSDEPVDITDRELTAALSPIKAFLTRQGVDHEVIFGQPSLGLAWE